MTRFVVPSLGLFVCLFVCLFLLSLFVLNIVWYLPAGLWHPSYEPPERLSRETPSIELSDVCR